MSRASARRFVSACFFFNDTATTEIYTLSLHDALPIFKLALKELGETVHKLRNTMNEDRGKQIRVEERVANHTDCLRSEEHTSELQSRQYLVCRLLLEKKKTVLSI